MASAADTAGAVTAVPLELTDKDAHDVTLRRLEAGAYEIRTTGADPYLFTEPIASTFDPARQHVLAFEFFSATGTNAFQVFLGPPVSEAHSVSGPGLSRSEGWSSHAVDLKPALDRFGRSPRVLRLDFGSSAGKTVQIRALRLRPQTEQEVRLAARRAALRASEKALETRLRDYLDRAYPCRVTRVSVDDKQVLVEGETAGEPGSLFLAEVPLHEPVTELSRFPSLEPIPTNAAGRFSIRLDRRRKQGEREHDRLLSRWAVVREANGGKFELLSHARYADAVRPRADLPEERPRNKKGIGGITHAGPVSDLDDLGVAAGTVNIVVNGAVSTVPGPGRTPFPYAGRTWYAEDRYLEQLDKTLLEAAKRRLVMSAIVLIGQAGDAPAGAFGRLIAHPDADPAGIFAMPDVSSQEGLEAYAAALDLLAARYSRPDGKYGRIHHWILHNEINAGWVWTNAGEKTALLYMDLYHKSMRAAHLIARQYDPHARAFISLEHHWTLTPTDRFYAGRELLDLLVTFSQAEGDFPWAIAFHPYPQNLFDPRVWEDTEAAFTLDTPKITFKNLEVLDAWVKQPRNLFQGKHRRTIHLTEQGLNSPDYSEKSLRDQAAGMAYAWNKIKGLDTIEVFDYHNWVDNRGEGGLRIGLRRFPDDKDDPLGKKPIWFLFQALGTDNEEKSAAFAKSVIGIRDWSEIRHRGPIR
uniref:DUF5722 domain-containing protein n=1 Tax=uncultured Armatimonadetes bacterium TaxID=157466 RepID=A0A6J4J0P9_9BACT|nr:hypothetical protein AVDCRST_MAG63-2817 [uncultured Armatimonadetes bacterium]